MTNQNMIDEVFERLAKAPLGLTCNGGQVIAACGLLIAAIVTKNYTDPAARQYQVARFCEALQAYVNSMKVTAKLN